MLWRDYSTDFDNTITRPCLNQIPKSKGFKCCSKLKEKNLT